MPRICAVKAPVMTDQWLASCPPCPPPPPTMSVRPPHPAVGLRTTSTIMFGHCDAPSHWARHLAALRDLQASPLSVPHRGCFRLGCARLSAVPDCAVFTTLARACACCAPNEPPGPTLPCVQKRTGGISEFVPLPFVHMEAPLYLRGGCQQSGLA